MLIIRFLLLLFLKYGNSTSVMGSYEKSVIYWK